MRRRVYLATIASTAIAGAAGCSDDGGSDGTDGADGSDGTDGSEGSDGSDGSDGEPTTGGETTTDEGTTADEEATAAEESAATLTERWEVELDTNTASGAAYAVDATSDGVVIGNASGVYSITSDGDRRWYWDEPESYEDGGFGPVIADGDTIFAVAYREGVVAALDAASGEVRWRREGDGSATDVRGAAVGDYFATGQLERSLSVLDRSTGETVTTIDGFGASAAHGYDGTLVVSRFEEITAYDPATGEERWSTAEAGAFDDSAVVGNTLVGAGGGRVVGVDLDAGEELWTERLPDDVRRPVVAGAGDRAVVQWRRPAEAVRVMGAADGSTEWETDFAGATIPFDPAVSDGVIVLDSEDGYLALDVATGEELGSAEPFGLGAIAADAGGGVFYACDTSVTAYDL